jgi:hypothetical protein
MMNDKFLYENRPSVRKEFAETLYQRLSSQAFDRRLDRKGKRNMNGRKLWVVAPLAVLLAFGVLMAASSEVRANVMDFIREIAGFAVQESPQSPLADLDNATDPATASGSQDTAPLATVEIPALVLGDILQDPPFEFGIPQTAPAGFVLDEEAAVASSQDWVILSWSSSAGAEIEMLVEQEYSGYVLTYGEASTREVTVNAQPALLVLGGWNASHVWDDSYGVELHWQQDGHYYRLIWRQMGGEHNEMTALSEDADTAAQELIHMAESIP